MSNNIINFKNKVFLVTGANGHTGKNLCNKLVKLNATVIKTDLSSNKSNNLFFKADLTKKEDRVILIKKIKQKFKKLDVLVNNAAFIPESRMKVKKSKIYNKDFINLNLESMINLTELAMPLIKKSNEGIIVNISSIYGFLAHDYNLYKNTRMDPSLSYGLSKAGVIQFTKLIASKLGPKIRVNSISPGGIKRKQNKKFIERYKNKTFLKRMCTEDDISNAVIFLSSYMSRYITGQNIIVDGGYSIS